MHNAEHKPVFCVVYSTKLHNSMAFIWSLYVLWAVINAYFNDDPPSERFQNIFNLVTPPREVTVGVYDSSAHVVLFSNQKLI